MYKVGIAKKKFLTITSIPQSELRFLLISHSTMIRENVYISFRKFISDGSYWKMNFKNDDFTIASQD